MRQSFRVHFMVFCGASLRCWKPFTEVALPRKVPVCYQITAAGADKDVHRKLKPLPPLGSGNGPSRTNSFEFPQDKNLERPVSPLGGTDRWSR